jgi:hypothetical protein
VFIGSALFCLVFFGGIMLLAARASLGLSYLPVLVICAIIFLLGAAKAFIRLRAVSIGLHLHRKDLSSLAHMILWPLASALFLVNSIAASFSRRISWRGISYELKSPTEAVIINRE